jgi:hypothetical protein
VGSRQAPDLAAHRDICGRRAGTLSVDEPGENDIMTPFVIAAGLGQLALAVASLTIPRLLGWRAETAKLQPLTRAVFWTYAAYIFSFHLAFGLVSTFEPAWLLGAGPLARAVCGFIAVYWGVRLVIQFASFGQHAPPGRIFRLAEGALVALFATLTAVYAAAAFWPRSALS